jgi:hypothetical protein
VQTKEHIMADDTVPNKPAPTDAEREELDKVTGALANEITDLVNTALVEIRRSINNGGNAPYERLAVLRCLLLRVSDLNDATASLVMNGHEWIPEALAILDPPIVGYEHEGDPMPAGT